jgi:hypothetical protein
MTGSATPNGPTGSPLDRYTAVTCPYCLDRVRYNEQELYVRNAQEEHQRLDLSTERNPLRRADVLRTAFQRCPHAGAVDPHYLPVDYLTQGEPLTVALVGSSYAGKTHLLAAMLGEVERGGLEPYGLTSRPLNPDWHRRFVQDRILPLQEGVVLSSTKMAKFAFFADALLINGPAGARPVMFFDLGGEDLVEHGEVTRFLVGVGAFIFVIDPLRALRIPQLERLRRQAGIREHSFGDQAFKTVLGRLRQTRTGPYLRSPAAVVLTKSDLVRFEPPVRRWLGRPLPPALTDRELRAESRDVYAFVRHHGSAAWLQPFTACERSTLHFVSATGGQEQGSVFPHGVAPRRVLAPLLSVLAMSGMLPGARLKEAGL